MITGQKLLQYGFQKSNTRQGSEYFLKVKIPYEGKREFYAYRDARSSTKDGYWIIYMVNGIVASNNIHEEEQMRQLYFSITGEQIGDN